MNKNVEDIAKLLPDGLSKTGIEEINTMMEGIIENRVAKEMQLLEAKVSGFLSSKMDTLKEEAERDLMESNEYARAYQVYQSLKSVISEDLNSADSESAVSTYKEENVKLQGAVDTLNARLSEALTENEKLGTSVESLTENVKEIEEEKKLPFKSSEKAVVITNENVGRPSQDYPNGFLTEEVMRLSKALNNN
jgi:hypothetical protein